MSDALVGRVRERGAKLRSTGALVVILVSLPATPHGVPRTRGDRRLTEVSSPNGARAPRPVNVAVRVDQRVPRDAVLVNPGPLVPVDGKVIAGQSFVDEARVTGESMPAEKMTGSPSYAGTINQSGALEIRVERPVRIGRKGN